MIVGLLGFIGSGKGTSGEFFIENGYTPLSFADSLKDATSAIFGWDRSLLEGDTPESREFREKVDPFWSDKFGKDITPRYILQYMGTEVCRNNLLDSIWIDSLERKISQHENVVITDVRFNNEISFLKSLGAKLIQVDRLYARPDWYCLYQTYLPNNLALWDNIAKAKNIHASEYMWIGNADIDYVVENNSTIEYLKIKLSIIKEELCNG